MQCERFLENIPLYLEDRLDGAERAEWRRHFGSCAACRDTAMAHDPSLLFLRAEAPPPAEREVERHLAAALSRARAERIERRVRSGRVRRWAAAAVIVLGCGLAGLTFLGGGVDPGEVSSGTPAIARTERPAVEVEMDGGVTVYQFAEMDDATTTVAFVVNPEMRL